MATAFRVLAQSHGVAFLDAVTDWRERVRLGGGTDPRFGSAFQGWFGTSLPDRFLEFAFVPPRPQPATIEAWVIQPGAPIGDLVVVTPLPGGTMQAKVNPQFRARMREWRGTTPIVSFIRGNDHALAMLGRFPPYDFLDPDVPGIVPGVPVIDGAAIDRYVEPWAKLVAYPLAAAREETGAPMLHVLPPPPRAHVERARHLEVLDEVVRQYGFVPEALRLKWYRRFARAVRAMLAADGIETLDPPVQALDERGLLREEFSEGLTHGNRRYGALVAAQVEAWVEGRAP